MGGILRPVLPSIPCTSLPQMPQARTRTSTSFAPVSGTGISVISSFMYCSSTIAFIVPFSVHHVAPPWRPSYD
jgi:hypothetical protein